MKTLYIILCFIFLSALGYSAVITATSNGAWSNIATWDLARVPIDGDVIIIDADVTYTGSFSAGSVGYNFTSLTVNATRTFNITVDFSVAADMDGDVFTNNGIVDVDGNLSLTNKLHIDNNNSFNVDGTFYMNSASTEFNNAASATLTVGSTFTNDQAIFTNGVSGNVNITGNMSLDNLGTNTNSGTITCDGFSMNNGTVTNNAGGVIDIGAGGSLINGSNISNAGLMDFDQLVTIDGLNVGNTGGTFNARGGLTLNNNACFTGGTVNYWGTLTNPGTCTFAGVTLPIELTDFYGQQVGSGIELEWTTASEKNNAYFKVERSVDSYTYEKIGEIAGNGTTSEASYYSFIHKEPSEGLNYYRLLQIDYDGTSSYSDIISVYNVQEANVLESAIVKRGTPVVLTGLSNNSQIVLATTAGLSQTLSNTTGTLEIQTNDLMPGAYYLAINHEDKYVQKINFVVVE